VSQEHKLRHDQVPPTCQRSQDGCSYSPSLIHVSPTSFPTSPHPVQLLLPQHPTDSSSRKPATALADPYPAPTPVPRFSAQDDCCDYESELCVVIGKPCKDVSEADALDYVLGYTASNDISHRDTQFEQSQWGFSKGFDGSCPIGTSNASSPPITFTTTKHPAAH
jgi:2-keto-4-pentenoate hydratase/2-oxohepta-3-ene-1,7-dioic acid hydratase in catechol pathway